MPFHCPHCVDAAPKISSQYLFQCSNWNVPNLRITCTSVCRTDVIHEEGAFFGDSSNFALDFISVSTRYYVSMISGHFPHRFSKTGNDVTVTSSARFSRRALDNVNLSIDSCCLQLVLASFDVDDQKTRWRHCDVIVIA